VTLSASVGVFNLVIRSERKSALVRYCEKHGIRPQRRKPAHNHNSIGFSEKEQKWYGWSHRGIYGFKVGDVVKEGDVIAGSLPIRFKAKTVGDAKKMAMVFAEGVA